MSQEFKRKMFGRLKKDLAFALIFWILASLVFPILGLAAPVEGQAPYKQKFLVSAYYSPLPGQSRYLRGTYEKDIRLNGRGVAGADGTAVYDGMLAAPKNYAFGMKIFVPGLGIGTVHDRGGAIVTKSGYDRIDVWMGYGDAGLTRALTWGMRMVEGTIYPVGANLADNLDYTWLPTDFAVSAKTVYTPAPVQVFSQGLGLNAEGEEVEILQKKLQELGYFNAEITGKYGTQTVEAVFNFQKDQKIVTDWNSYGAGYFGTQTRTSLNKIVAQKEQEKQAEEIQVASQNPTEETQILIASGLGKDAEGEDVKELQQTLKDLGYYNGEITGLYDEATIQAVLNFQTEKNVINHSAEYGAGYFWPKTKQALAQAVALKETEVQFGKVLAGMDFQVQKMTVAFAENTVESRSMVFSSEQKAEVLASVLYKGTQGAEVVALQKMLKEAGYLKIEQETEYFGTLTERALIQYQIDHGIIANENTPGAGIVDPQTYQNLTASTDGSAGV